MRMILSGTLISLLLLTVNTLQAAQPQESAIAVTYSRAELLKARPANGFRLVYSDNDPVCDTVLEALNEPGYDNRYFNSSDKYKHSLPELLIQTRLNAPRTLIGTHLFRTEEYEIDSVDGTKKEYWYRFIGQGDSMFGQGYTKQSWMSVYKEMYSDFFNFIDNGLPYHECYYNNPLPCVGFRLTVAVEQYFWRNDNFDIYVKESGLNFPPPWGDKYPMIDMIILNKTYYLISSDANLKSGEYVRVVVNDFNEDSEFHRVGRGVCFYKFKFKFPQE